MKYYSRRDDIDEDIPLDWVEGDISKMTEDELWDIACQDCEGADNLEIQYTIVVVYDDGEEDELYEFGLCKNDYTLQEPIE